MCGVFCMSVRLCLLHFCLIFCMLNFLFSAYPLLRNVFRSPSMTVDLFFLTVLVKFVLCALWLLVEGTTRLHMCLSSKQNLTVMSWPPSSPGLRSDEYSTTWPAPLLIPHLLRLSYSLLRSNLSLSLCFLLLYHI